MIQFGLLGKTLSHSMSPQIHSMIFKHTKISGNYKLFPMEAKNIPNLINDIRQGKIKGINVTIPYKEIVIDMLDEVSKEAIEIGAVNTICLVDNKLVGYNTDYFGFRKTLSLHNVVAKDKQIAVLGTGGSAKSIVYVLKSIQAKKIAIYSRTPNTTEKIHGIASLPYTALDSKHNYDIIVNTTPVGMFPKVDNSPIDKRALGNAKTIIDIIYNPFYTKLLLDAKTKGKISINGMYMLIAQAVKAQEIFNNMTIDDDVIKEIYFELTGGEAIG